MQTIQTCTSIRYFRLYKRYDTTLLIPLRRNNGISPTIYLSQMLSTSLNNSIQYQMSLFLFQSDGEEMSLSDNLNDIHYSLKYQTDLLFTRCVFCIYFLPVHFPWLYFLLLREAFSGVCYGVISFYCSWELTACTFRSSIQGSALMICIMCTYNRTLNT